VNTDAVLNYQFRLLKAELVSSKDPNQALKLIAADPPTELQTGEFAVRRKIIEALGHGYLQDYVAANGALDEAERRASLAPVVLPNVVYARAYLLERQGNEAASQLALHRTAELAQLNKEWWLVADSYNFLASYEMDHERYDRAIDYLSTSLEQSKGTNSGIEEISMGKLGWSYYQLGEAEQAISSLEYAKKLAEKISRLQDQQNWANDLGDVYQDHGDDADAEKNYLIAVSLARRLKDNVTLGGVLRNLSMLEIRRGNLEKAETYNQQAMEAVKTSADPSLHSDCIVTAAEIAEHRGQYASAESMLRSVAPQITDSSLSWRTESDLANVYVAEKKYPEADKEFRQAIHTVETARTAVQQEERRMSILDAWPFYDDYIRFLVSQDRKADALQVAELSRARTLSEGLKINHSGKTGAVNIRKVQGLLKSGQRVVLAYWLAEKESYLWAFTSSTFELYRLPPQSEIEAEIRSYSAQIQDHRGLDDSVDGQKLYDMLVRPAAGLIAKNARVTIIPNRTLYTLNFETLVAGGGAPHYWLRDVAIETAGSVALLAEESRRVSAKSRDLLLIGAPVEARSQYPVLKFARQEMDNVKGHFPASAETVITGKDATPESYISSAPEKFRFVHFVTHGTASNVRPLDSAIILSPQQGSHEYRLFAREIVDRPIHADVVTISACYGAGTRTYSGEGLVGLAWAFMRAGAHQVVAGLWEVDDSATPELMNKFYDYLKQGATAAQALRAAKLDLMKEQGYKYPFYWASLQLYTGS
jgi:CHAT domain-containing protein